MNAPDKLAQLLALTRDPFPASIKSYVGGQLHPQLRVPMRDVHLSNGEIATLYDTSGPYTATPVPRSTCAGTRLKPGAWLPCAPSRPRCSALPGVPGPAPT